MSSTVEKIKEKLSAAEVVGSYIKLDKAGSNFKAKCPFHNEKTPSFFVSPSRGSYYCFGCGAKGDIFTFVQEFEGTDFMGALKILSDRAGVPIESENVKEKKERERLYKALDSASIFFEENLQKNPDALAYLKKRGLTKDTVREWRLGFVPEEWRLLFHHLIGKGFQETELVQAGLIKKSAELKSQHENFYDVFRGRVTFPIFDSSARIIGFSGRIIFETKDVPKYLNTPETPLFNKSEALYGIHKAKTAIRSKDYSILVEGQMDLLMCHQSGFTNAVATSGTAFTRGHLDRLRRISNRILLAFDSDSAGFAAANRSAELALLLGMEVKIAELTKDSDPVDLIIKDISLWREVLKNSKHIIDFYLDHLLAEVTDKRTIAKEVKKRVLPYLTMLRSSLEQSHFVSQIAKKTGLREEAVWTDLKNTKTPDVAEEYLDAETKEEKGQKRRNHIERKIAGIIFWQKNIENPTISLDELGEAIGAIAGGVYLESLLKSLEGERDELVFEAEVSYENSEKLKKDLDELLLNFEEDLLREQFVSTMMKLQGAEEVKNEKEARTLLTVCQEISIKLAELSKKKMVNADVRE